MSSVSESTAETLSTPPATAEPAAHKARTHHRTRRKLLGPVVLGLIAAGVLVWLGREVYHGYHFVETDNAYVVGHLHQVGPQVEGRVVAVLVQDNQLVAAGDPLVRLDPLEFRLAVEKAEATVRQARAQAAQAEAVASQSAAQVTAADAHVDETQAQLAQTTAQLELAQLTLQRTEDLFQRGGVVSQADLDTARTAAHAATAAQKASQATLAAARSDSSSARAAQISAAAQTTAAQAAIAVAESALRDAQRQLGYTTVVAPSTGRVGNKSVEVGNYIVPGQVVLVIAESEPWIVANFKETQLARMQPNQPVELTIDAIPGHTLHGTVQSFSPASGAQFALLPPDNATSNFNKVVQRVPVKIVLDAASLRDVGDRLRLGLSAIVDIRVR